MKKLIYFDSAATSYPKPRSVFSAMEECLVNAGGNPGRSAHVLSMNASKKIYSCREEICTLLSFSYPENVVFTYNTTYALNMAIKGLYDKSKGEKIIVSDLEHNSVLRPVYSVLSGNESNMTVFSATGSDEEIIADFKEKLTPDTSLAVVTVASNVCGKVLPIQKIGEICRRNGTRVVVDTAQSMGCVPFDFDSLCADAVCAPGHKGLYGIQGCGFCVFAKDVEPECILQGGNGVNSADINMTNVLPEALEAGTLGTPAICALCEGIKYVRSIGVNEIFAYNSYLCDMLCDGLRNIDGVTVYGESENRTPCVLFNVRDVSSEEVAMKLSEKGICVRSGLHCAPLAHKALKTGESGAVRASLSFGNTKREIDRFLNEIRKI